MVADEQDKPISNFFPEVFEFIRSTTEDTRVEEQVTDVDLETMPYPNSTATMTLNFETHVGSVTMSEQEKHYSRIQFHYSNITTTEKEEENKQQARMLIHCAMGKSRSATSFIMYVMRRFNMNVSDAFEFCYTQRQETEPNEGFMEQLRVFEANGRRFESEL